MTQFDKDVTELQRLHAAMKEKQAARLKASNEALQAQSEYAQHLTKAFLRLLKGKRMGLEALELEAGKVKGAIAFGWEEGEPEVFLPKYGTGAISAGLGTFVLNENGGVCRFFEPIEELVGRITGSDYEVDLTPLIEIVRGQMRETERAIENAKSYAK